MMIKNEKLQILLIAIVTAIAGEFRITPFSGEVFRIGLGTSIFLLFLLFSPHLLRVQTGIITGAIVLLFRLSGDLYTNYETFQMITSLENHFPAFVFYFLFAFGISMLPNKLNHMNPLILGALVSIIDFLSNGGELLTRWLLNEATDFSFHRWYLFMVVAVVRSYFVIGLFSSISINQMRSIHIEQRKRLNQTLNIGSGLYGETFYLKKSMESIEVITEKSYELYHKLKAEGRKELSQDALEITQEIHEIKKDSQRILAGLTKIFDNKLLKQMKLSEIIDFVITSNQKYSDMLFKDIIFTETQTVNYSTAHYIPLITLLNNLLSNAVEAIDKEGTINIKVLQNADETIFIIQDSGSGIQDQDSQIIFEPGFTTKFNKAGIASTGIGLSHVRDIIRSFNGEIKVSLNEQEAGTTFIINLPTNMIRKGE